MRKRQVLVSLSILIGILLSFTSKSLAIEIEEARFGSEFTVSSDLIGKLFDPNHQWDSKRKGKYIQAISESQIKLVESAKVRCPDCKIEELPRSPIEDLPASKMYRIIYPDGYWIIISNDPGVIETQALPVTVKEYEKLEPRFQRDIFDSGANFGLFPDTFMSGGHIHISFDIFLNEPLLLRNFLVDFANHFELAEGILDLNEKNAPSLRSLGEERVNKLKKLISFFDQGKLLDLKGKPITSSLGLAEAYFNVIQEYSRYAALNVKRFNLGEFATIEVRSIATQKSFAEFLLQIKLFQARLKYLKKISDNGVRIAVLDYVDHSSKGMGAAKFRKLLTQKYYDYVTESNLSWESYRKNIYMSDLRRKKIIPFCKALF